MKKFYLTTLVIMAVALISIQSTSSAANLLNDPGFETGNGWSNWGDSNYVTDIKISGGQSAHAWTWNNADGNFEQTIDVTPGVSYKAGGYIKSSGLDTGSAWIQFRWNGVGTAVESAKLTTANADWAYYETPLTVAPEGATTAKVAYMLLAPAYQSANDVYFDDASFEAVPEPASLLLFGSGLAGFFSTRGKRRGRGAREHARIASSGSLAPLISKVLDMVRYCPYNKTS
ncbi:MAG: PEP-CTERM sorting domain-containing protein [Candidatus Omnitrophota bacterium]